MAKPGLWFDLFEMPEDSFQDFFPAKNSFGCPPEIFFTGALATVNLCSSAAL
jgi:hypothetical protein